MFLIKLPNLGIMVETVQIIEWCIKEGEFVKQGDVLLRVNDYEINSPEKGVQLLNGLKGESRLSLDLIRNSQPLKLQYQIR